MRFSSPDPKDTAGPSTIVEPPSRPARSAPLAIPAGPSTVTNEAERSNGDEALTGDRWTDFGRAVRRVHLVRDFENATQIPCFRKAMLWGIGGGVGVGAIRALWTTKFRTIGAWSGISFVLISSFQWETCRAARARELDKMRRIQEAYPQRHISRLNAAESSPTEPTSQPNQR